MFRYVKVDNNGLPERDAWVENHEAPEEDMIEISSGFNLTNRKYVDGEWEYIVEPPEYEIISNEEQAQLELQTNIQYLVDLAEINMEG